MIYRRFTEKSAEEWRQIYKSLQLLEFLIKHGSERVIDDARSHITLLKMLRQFHFIDQNGKDQGINVRNRAKELAELLGDVDRIRAERKKARATKNKFIGTGSSSSMGGGYSGGSGRFSGFGSDTSGYGGSAANFGGYSGGVYGDGGGFGGQSSDFRDGSGRADRFEEYDEFDEGERPTAPSRPKKTERAGVKKTTGEVAKKKEPEVDLFSFDDGVQGSSLAAPTPLASSGLAGPSGGGAAHDDDEFDDFQEATPATQTQSAAPLSGLGQPLPPMTASAVASPAQFAAPQPLSAPQKADLGKMISTSSTSPVSSAGANYSAFASPPPAQAGAAQSSGPNYFGSVQAQAQPAAQPSGGGGLAAMSAAGGTSSMASMKPVSGGSAAKAAPAGGDAFGALWGRASGGGLKKSSTAGSGTSMGQLAKEKSAAGIWGAPASASPQPNTSRPAPSGGSASEDLLG